MAEAPRGIDLPPTSLAYVLELRRTWRELSDDRFTNQGPPGAAASGSVFSNTP